MIVARTPNLSSHYHMLHWLRIHKRGEQMPEEPKPMTPGDAKLAADALALVTQRQRRYFLDRAKSLRAQAAAKIKR